MADGTLVGIHGGGLTGILGGREKVYRFSGWLRGSIVDLWFGGGGAQWWQGQRESSQPRAQEMKGRWPFSSRSRKTFREDLDDLEVA